MGLQLLECQKRLSCCGVAFFIAAFLILNWLVPTQIPFLAEEIGRKTSRKIRIQKDAG